MKLLDEYFDLQNKLYEHFGYVEDWAVIPIDDARKYYWNIDGGDDRGVVCFADTEQELKDKDGQYYENEIYTQRHLPKWVYRADDYTMICVDTHTDGNKFLQIFDNSKDRTEA